MTPALLPPPINGNDLPKLIGLAGATGSGKSTVGRLLQDRGYVRMAIAQPIKDMLLALGLTEQEVSGSPEQRSQPSVLLGGKTPREAMQLLSVRWGRNSISPNIWTDVTRHRVEVALRRGQKVVVDDLRFPNDWAMLQSLSGQIVRIRRPGFVRERTQLDRFRYSYAWGVALEALRVFGWKPIHETEYHWPDAPADAELLNTGSVDELDAHLTAALLSMAA